MYNSGHLDCVEVLLEKGADPNQLDQEHASPLHKVIVSLTLKVALTFQIGMYVVQHCWNLLDLSQPKTGQNFGLRGGGQRVFSEI